MIPELSGAAGRPVKVKFIRPIIFPMYLKFYLNQGTLPHSLRRKDMRDMTYPEGEIT